MPLYISKAEMLHEDMDNILPKFRSSQLVSFCIYFLWFPQLQGEPFHFLKSLLMSVVRFK